MKVRTREALSLCQRRQEEVEVGHEGGAQREEDGAGGGREEARMRLRARSKSGQPPIQNPPQKAQGGSAPGGNPTS